MNAPQIRFDRTINLGHILTFLGFLITIFAAWVNLDKRVVVLETEKVTQLQKDRHQDEVSNKQAMQIRESLTEIKGALIRLEQKVEGIKK